MKIYREPVYSDPWTKMCHEEWNLDWVREHFKDERSKYRGRAILVKLDELERQVDGYVVKNWEHPGQEFFLPEQKKFSCVESTLKQLHKNITRSADNPFFEYLQRQTALYERLNDSDAFGFYALYFDLTGEPLYLVQFPPLPLFKLSLYSSVGGLYRDKDYKLTWLELRQLLNKTHILVAGASVASATAFSLLGDLRPTYLSIGDPKPPNSTNFNRTAYNIHDVMVDESKAIAFARHVHAQDPTQILYLAPAGFTPADFPSLVGSRGLAPPPDLLIEAVDDIKVKVALLKFAQAARLPTIMVADVGSVAQNNFLSPSDLDRGLGVVLGLKNDQLDELMSLDFTMAAAMMTGLDDALHDEVGHFVKGDKNSPCGETVPQLGSTSQAAAAIATEAAIRYLIAAKLKQEQDFPWRRISFDKKRLKLKRLDRPTLLASVLNLTAARKLKSALK